MVQSFPATDNLSMTQPNNRSSPMPAKNQRLNEKVVFLKHIRPFPCDPASEGYKWKSNGNDRASNKSNMVK